MKWEGSTGVSGEWSVLSRELLADSFWLMAIGCKEKVKIQKSKFKKERQ
jgi:hypothetical protein